MSAAAAAADHGGGRVRPLASDQRARLLTGYQGWDTQSLVAELAGNVRDLKRVMTPVIRQHAELRVQVLREILARRQDGPGGPEQKKEDRPHVAELGSTLHYGLGRCQAGTCRHRV